MKRFFDGFPPTAHPMAILSAMVASLSSYYPDALDVDNMEQRDITIARLLVEGAHHRGVRLQEVDRPAVRLPEELALVLRELPQHDVLGPGRALRGRPRAREGAEPAPHPARRPRAELLHVDRAPRRSAAGQPLRVDLAPASARSGARSTAAPTRRCSRCSTAIHKRRRRRAEVRRRSRRTRTRNFRLMGFGHRVYKNFDPRAKIIKAAADKVLAKLGIKDPLLDIAKALEEAALKDSYFVERKLYPNVDFYSRHHLPRAGLPDEHVHGAVRARPPARLDRPLEGDDGGPDDQDRAARGRSTRGRRCGTTWRWRSGRRSGRAPASRDP